MAVQTTARQLAAVDLTHLDYDAARVQLAELTARHDEINKTADMLSRRAAVVEQVQERVHHAPLVQTLRDLLEHRGRHGSLQRLRVEGDVLSQHVLG